MTLRRRRGIEEAFVNQKKAFSESRNFYSNFVWSKSMPKVIKSKKRLNAFFTLFELQFRLPQIRAILGLFFIYFRSFQAAQFFKKVNMYIQPIYQVSSDRIYAHDLSIMKIIPCFVFFSSLPITRSEPQTSGVRSNHSANWGTTTALKRSVFVAQLVERSLPTPELSWFKSGHWQI